MLSEMPEWLLAVLLSLITATGGFFGGIVAMRKTASDERTSRDLERQAFIDQVQEERDAAHLLLKSEREEFTTQLQAERKMLHDERVEYTSRLDRMWADKSATRDHVAALRLHIWEGKPPPPPEPPVGYIH